MKNYLIKIVMLIPFIGFSQSTSVYITNEGNFQAGNGSLSIYDKTTNVVTNNVFSSLNGGALLGDVVQSIEFFDGKGYICVNNSSKIQVIDENGLYITDISVVSPRYLKQVDANKAYVTDWGINGVQVIDLVSNTVSSTINCGSGPEGLVVSNGFAYVCNSGGWGLDSTVTVINTVTDAVETTLLIGDKPNSSVVDKDGNVWVLTSGHTEYDANWNVIAETSGKLVKINTSTNMLDLSFTFPVGNHPEDLVINSLGDKLYYSDGSWQKSVYEFDIFDLSLPNNPFISRSFYGLGYDPISNEIYGSDAVDYVQQGWIYRYATTGMVVDSFLVGIIPGNFAFNEEVLSYSNIDRIKTNIYPNPSKGKFFVNCSERIQNIIVRNVLGSIIKSNVVNNLSDVIDLTDFEKGIYVVDIKTESGFVTKKLIVD